MPATAEKPKPKTNGKQNGRKQHGEDAEMKSFGLIFNGMSKDERELFANVVWCRTELIRQALDRIDSIDEECGYKETLELDDYIKMYKRGDVARRVVDGMPKECWSVDPEVYEVEDENITPFEQAWLDLCKQVNLYHNLERIDCLSGIGTFGVLLLGFGDKKALDQPVSGVGLDGKIDIGLNGRPNRAVDSLKLLFTRPIRQDIVDVMEVDEDPTSVRYQHPTKYRIRFHNQENPNLTLAQNPVRDTTPTEVHWHRVIHVPAENGPRMEVVYNRLQDYHKLLGGSAEMFWKGGFMGLSLETQNEPGGMAIDVKALRDQVEKYQAKLQRYLATSGINVKSLAPQIADPSHHIDAHLEAIAIAIEMPQRVLRGSERGELASTQDSKSWRLRVRNRQVRHISPILLMPFTDRMIAAGVLPVPAAGPDKYLVHWPDLNVLSETEKAEVAVKYADANYKYMLGMLYEIIPPEEWFTKFLGKTSAEAKAIIAASQKWVNNLSGLLQDGTDKTEGNKASTTPKDTGGTRK